MDISVDPKISFQYGSCFSSVGPEISVWILGFQCGCWKFIVYPETLGWIMGLQSCDFSVDLRIFGMDP